MRIESFYMTECNKCGDCCETITFSQIEKVTDIVKWVTHPDSQFINREDLDVNVIDALFITDNWELNDDEKTYHCNKFDKVNRLCSMHESRPYVCRGFPWYGKETHEEAISIYKNCSFWADIKMEEK